MAQGKRTGVRMQFGDGSVIDEWLTMSLRETFTDPLSDLHFEAAPARERIAEYYKKLQKGELVTVFVNDVNQGSYLIQTSETSIDPASGVTFALSCNTVLVTPFQGSVKQPFSFKSQTYSPVGKIIADVLGPYGFEDIIGDPASNVSALTGIPIDGGRKAITVDALKSDQATADDGGESAYEFCKRIITRLGLALGVDFDGVLLTVVPDYDQDVAYSLVQSADVSLGGDRFIGRITMTDTNDNQFSECRIIGVKSDQAGQTQTARPDATVTSAELFSNRPAYKSTAAPYKPLIIKDKNSTSIERCKSTAKLALGKRAKDAFVVSGEVDGFVSTTGRIWTPNTMVDVRIDAVGFHEVMWVLERTFTQDRQGGQKTRLKLIPPGALVLGDIP
jgi:hypothetical protein